MQKNKTTLDKLFLVLIAMITILFTSFSTISATAFASETEYSSVMEDLSKVDDFNKEKYPYVEKDHSINVIQIAESEAKQLFVYTYQPTGQAKQLKATTVRIATSTGDDKSYHDYQLTLLNSNGVFFKYLVNGLEVKNDTTRYYDIPAIHRKYIEGVDTPPSEGQTIDEVAFEVGRLWTATTENEKVTYSYKTSETITITDKYVGFVRYSDYPGWVNTACDRHFVAFSTDRPIDNLIEAEVEYSTQSFYGKYLAGNPMEENVEPFHTAFGEKLSGQHTTLTLSNNHTGVTIGSSGLIGTGWHTVKEWDRIQRIGAFIDSVNVEHVYEEGLFDIHVQSKINEEAKEKLQTYQWVLSFTDTEYLWDRSVTGGGGNVNKTIVGEVTILRLKFETNHQIHNLGVVDNKQTGSTKPDNTTTVTITFAWDRLLKFLGTILCVILAIVFSPQIIQFIVWVITLPFKIFRKRR